MYYMLLLQITNIQQDRIYIFNRIEYIYIQSDKIYILNRIKYILNNIEYICNG